MEKLIMIKYGELSTKKGNIGFFLNTLKNNIVSVLDGLNYELKHDKSRMFIEVDDLNEAVERLKKVFGIHEINICYKIGNLNLDDLGNNLVEKLKQINFNTFKVETKRSFKGFSLTSMEISKKVGGLVLKSIANVKVDVHNPEILINIEIRNDAMYFYFDKIPGIGGYPVGALGKGLLMLSGGIDLLVAGYMAIKRGIKL